MKKRMYRAINVNRIDQMKLATAVAGKRVVLGIDVAKGECFGRMLDEQRQVVATIKWQQLEQTGELVQLLGQLPASKVEAAMEPSSTYGDALRWQLEQAGVPVYRVSGKRCHDAAEVYDGVPSMHDAKAADVVARLHLDGASRLWEPKSEKERELAATIHTMAMYDEQHDRTLNRLEAVLARHWPELPTVLALDSATLLALLAQFGGPRAVAQHAEAARGLMRQVGGHYLPIDKIDRVIHSARQTIGQPMIDPEQEAVRLMAQEVQRCRRAAATEKKLVIKLSEADPEIERLGSVVGVVTAAVLVSTAGPMNRYDSAGAYVKALGMNLKERSSGKYKGQLKITKRGPSVARQYLYMAALRMVQNRGDAVVRAWYLRKVVRDGGRIKMKAVVAVMRKLAGALWHVGQGASFDSSRLFDVSRLRRELAELAV